MWPSDVIFMNTMTVMRKRRKYKNVGFSIRWLNVWRLQNQNLDTGTIEYAVIDVLFFPYHRLKAFRQKLAKSIKVLLRSGVSKLDLTMFQRIKETPSPESDFWTVLFATRTLTWPPYFKVLVVIFLTPVGCFWAVGLV